MLDKRGMAALLDALIFLIVAAIVSVSLVTVTSDRYQVAEEDLRGYVDMAHETILRTTVQMAIQFEIEGTWMTVRDFAIAYILSLDKQECLDQYERGMKDIAEIIYGLIPAWTNFTWTVTHGAHELSIGDAPTDAEYVWPSCIFSEMPILGGELRFKLEIWR